MIDSIILIRRQSPDWRALARDYRNGHSISPARYVPDHPIPGFPPDVESLIRRWNSRFAIDFFTTRRIIARLSEECTHAVAGAATYDLSGLADLAERARVEQFFAFFHDDDDFFAVDILDILRGSDVWHYDTCVSPLYKVHADPTTFVRSDMRPDFILGTRQNFDFRFQSNNYGLSSRICNERNLRALKDHVLASRFADAEGFSEKILSCPVSATVKTPASASLLPALAGEGPELRMHFNSFIASFRRLDLPPDKAWLARPVGVIARLFQAIIDGAAHDDISDLVEVD